MFLLMMTFFVYPADFAMETASQGIIPVKYTAIIMASMDIMGFLGGLVYSSLRMRMGHAVCFTAPLLFLIGYLLLGLLPGWTGTLLGSFLIGFANGIGVPYIMSTASAKAGPAGAVSVMSMISLALYLAQFLTPFLLSAVTPVIKAVMPGSSSYSAGALFAFVFLIWSVIMFRKAKE